MGQGQSPMEAAESALSRIIEYYPDFSGALVAVNTNGDFGAACHGLVDESFPFSVGTGEDVVEYSVSCI